MGSGLFLDGNPTKTLFFLSSVRKTRKTPRKMFLVRNLDLTTLIDIRPCWHTVRLYLAGKEFPLQICQCQTYCPQLQSIANGTFSVLWTSIHWTAKHGFKMTTWPHPYAKYDIYVVNHWLTLILHNFPLKLLLTFFLGQNKRCMINYVQHTLKSSQFILDVLYLFSFVH